MAEPGTAGPASTSGLPPITLPSRLAGKVRSVSKATGFDRGSDLRRDDRIDPNQSIQSLRRGTTAAAQMRSLVDVDGLVSAVALAFVATAQAGWHIEAFQTWTNETSREGLIAAETVISGLETLWNYTQGFQDKPSLSQLVETALLEVVLTGGVGAELVLDTSRIPQGIVIFPYDSITWKSNGKGGRYPAQKDPQGAEVELNYPTIFVGECFKSAQKLYATPFMHSGVKSLIQYSAFVEDMQRVLRKNGQPRTLAKLDYQKVVASAPVDVIGDPNQLSTYLDTVRSSVEQLLSAIEPEDAIVYYDLMEVTGLQSTGEKRDYKELLAELSGLAASALKSNPSALGLRLGGSQNIASTEAMLSMKVARLLQGPVETVLSRALTLAARLYGIDCYVKFRFDEIDLRPKNELEAHKAMAQARILELLSLGRITDDEAQVQLGLGSLPVGADELAGTNFYGSKAPDTMPVSASNARNQSIAPSGSKAAGGKDNATRA